MVVLSIGGEGFWERGTGRVAKQSDGRDVFSSIIESAALTVYGIRRDSNICTYIVVPHNYS